MPESLEGLLRELEICWLAGIKPYRGVVLFFHGKLLTALVTRERLQPIEPVPVRLDRILSSRWLVAKRTADYVIGLLRVSRLNPESASARFARLGCAGRDGAPPLAPAAAAVGDSLGDFHCRVIDAGDLAPVQCDVVADDDAALFAVGVAQQGVALAVAAAGAQQGEAGGITTQAQAGGDAAGVGAARGIGVVDGHAGFDARAAEFGPGDGDAARAVGMRFADDVGRGAAEQAADHALLGLTRRVGRAVVDEDVEAVADIAVAATVVGGAAFRVGIARQAQCGHSGIQALPVGRHGGGEAALLGGCGCRVQQRRQHDQDEAGPPRRAGRGSRRAFRGSLQADVPCRGPRRFSARLCYAMKPRIFTAAGFDARLCCREADLRPTNAPRTLESHQHASTPGQAESYKPPLQRGEGFDSLRVGSAYCRTISGTGRAAAGIAIPGRAAVAFAQTAKIIEHAAGIADRDHGFADPRVMVERADLVVVHMYAGVRALGGAALVDGLDALEEDRVVHRAGAALGIARRAALGAQRIGRFVGRVGIAAAFQARDRDRRLDPVGQPQRQQRRTADDADHDIGRHRAWLRAVFRRQRARRHAWRQLAVALGEGGMAGVGRGAGELDRDAGDPRLLLGVGQFLVGFPGRDLVLLVLVPGFAAIARDALRGAAGLLHDMGEFVRDQVLAGGRLRRVLAGGEHDVRAGGIGLRVDRFGRSRRLRVGMHTYVAEVLAEALFHLFTQAAVERAAAAAQGLLHAVGCGAAGRIGAARGQALDRLRGRRDAVAAGRRGHRRGDAVRFAFERIVGSADAQLALDAAFLAVELARAARTAAAAGAGPGLALQAQRFVTGRGRWGCLRWRGCGGGGERGELSRIHGRSPVSLARVCCLVLTTA